MTISYNWLSEYLPVKIDPERLSRILTSIGLEVEKMEVFEEVKGGLKGLVIGEVLETEKHPNADKLTVTKVSTGGKEPLQIVCGAPNVAAGQKVVVATVGTTIHPTAGDSLTMKIAKIRGVESYGMICAEDELGLGTSHAGIMVLNADAKVGQTAEEYFKPYTDIIYEIGLTPNRMDAMSHWGVARDVCAYITHHDKKEARPVMPSAPFKVDNQSLKISVSVENENACKRYAGVCISNIKVQDSPKWLQNKLKAIGLRPINNIVDITNFIQHETGQPLHAFDYNEIKGSKVVVNTLPEGTPFVTLDEKERKLSSEDLMICDAEEGMCIAGVFGGLHSGVSEKTTNIFLESAWFDPTFIRKTSFRHNLRTDAATRFEKGVDISNTVSVLKRAAALMKEIAGGEIASDIVDIYPDPQPKQQIVFKFQYLKKLSGKNYHPQTIRNILQSLGFTILREDIDALFLEVPYHKHDISIQADLVEEILRIDGLDNVTIPTSITITPAIEENKGADQLKEKIAGILVGNGFNEILTNSITNSKYFTELELSQTVKLLNNLSIELDVMRPAMLPTALEVIAFNQNRKNNDLKFFEWGKTYKSAEVGKYEETSHFCIYLTGAMVENHWKGKGKPADIYYLKGIVEAVFRAAGVTVSFATGGSTNSLELAITGSANGTRLVEMGKISGKTAHKFDIKQTVFYADINWDVLVNLSLKKKISYTEISKFPAVERDLAIVVPKDLKYEAIKGQLDKLRLNKLQHIQLFDVFESEKLGAGKKSMAVNFTFLDEEKTLTDKEIDSWMNKIMTTLEKELGAEIRK
ncbi:phenylalanine--tRNA ligase subunit beta [Chitinophagaceae bacterium LB-8]|uniref:Phenylalanine--tRNA ligase beta subunit n=1 Tax=Paraflavisolibacter caeni TaxID=2982496 RepID=A0A9X2XNE1_9BACT|nr:phenylalanine--tRNA ligase subunit beta [Paraflavisolibacter caeni]MCU7547964.1 phenylalanine--tRNA ligase subunit beta [Paraflavisolibacter caeni]